MCISIIHARLHMQLTASVCLLDIGFAFVLTSASHASRHRLRMILTSAAHIIDIGFALTPTTLETQPTLTLQNSQIRVDIGFALSWHMLRIQLDFGFALSWTDCTRLSLEIMASASHSSWHRLRIIWNLSQYDIHDSKKIILTWPPQLLENLFKIYPKTYPKTIQTPF